MVQHISDLFPDYLKYLWKLADENRSFLQEIRMRSGKPVILRMKNREYYIEKSGALSENLCGAYIITEKDLSNIIHFLCQYSIYAYEDELKQGYFTVTGGHRIGVAGKMTMENNQVKNMKYISSINIRIAHEIRGTADKVMPYVYQNHDFCSTLIIAAPGAGKTTLLRDMIRQISDGNAYASGKTVSVIDERSEIGGCYLGIPQNDIGMRTDILDGCPKRYGMMMMVRSMSPDVLAVDELGGMEDICAIREVLRCGCRILATVHGESIWEMKGKEWFLETMQKKYFQRYIVLNRKKGAGIVEGYYDEEGNLL